MESSSPQRRRDRGGYAEVNPGLQLSLRCLGGLCASAVNQIYSRAFLKALIVNNFNLHTLHLNGVIDPNGITLAGNLKVDYWRRIIFYALCHLYASGIY
jgi:hypothetical protein